jgi:endonuclease YncB( thermonuclease family)
LTYFSKPPTIAVERRLVMAFKVTNVIDGDTFEVSPEWKWDDHTGSVVRPNGYNTPEQGEEGYQEAKDKLTRLILGKDVELKNAVSITYGRLLCDVYYNGKNLADYFPEYQ